MLHDPTVISVCSDGRSFVPREWAFTPEEDGRDCDPVARFVDMLKVDGKRVTLEKVEVQEGSFSTLGNCALNLTLKDEDGIEIPLQVWFAERGVSREQIEKIRGARGANRLQP